jgi:linoleoyl-CoA desaturase
MTSDLSAPPINPGTPHGIANSVKFGVGDDFLKVLKRRVDRYFRFTGLSPHDNPRMYAKTAIILLWLCASYALLVFGVSKWWEAVPLAASLGLAMAAVGFNIQHDGGHKAYSRRKTINRLMAATLDLIGGSSYIWNHKHNTIHHTYPNIDGEDDDINVGLLARISPHQRRLKFHRLQHLYMWLLYGFLSIKWQLLDDFWNVAVGRIGRHRFARPKGWDLAVFIGGKALFFGLAFALPMVRHSIWNVLGLYAIVSLVNGVTLATVFQLAHVVGEAAFPMPDPVTGRMEHQWAIHQIETTVDFARGNRMLTWYLGGLNFQVEHHLFPRICHVYYPRIVRLVEKACRQHGVRYSAHESLTEGVISHFRWLRQMGRLESVSK